MDWATNSYGTKLPDEDFTNTLKEVCTKSKKYDNVNKRNIKDAEFKLVNLNIIPADDVNRFLAFCKAHKIKMQYNHQKIELCLNSEIDYVASFDEAFIKMYENTGLNYKDHIKDINIYISKYGDYADETDVFFIHDYIETEKTALNRILLEATTMGW